MARFFVPPAGSWAAAMGSSAMVGRARKPSGCIYTGGCGLVHCHDHWRSVTGTMTTNTEADYHMNHVLAQFSMCTETITAEHHPDEDGMKYVLYVIGGKHHGAEIHCATLKSVTDLFDSVVAARKSNREHPAFAQLSQATQ